MGVEPLRYAGIVWVLGELLGSLENSPLEGFVETADLFAGLVGEAELEAHT